MTNEQDLPQAEAQPPSEQPAGELPAKEVEEGKVFAILSYVLSFVSLPFFLVPLIMRNNEFSLYHAKQSLMIWLAGIVVSVIGVPLCAACVGFVILPVGGIALLVLNIMGLVNAVNGQAKPIPLIGKWGEDWFKGLRKG